MALKLLYSTQTKNLGGGGGVNIFESYVHKFQVSKFCMHCLAFWELINFGKERGGKNAPTLRNVPVFVKV
jgi:hypothetical protein